MSCYCGSYECPKCGPPRRHLRDHCRLCGQYLSNEWHAKKAKQKSENLKKGIAERKKLGLRIGRPRKNNYEAILKLRAKGFSLRKISEKLKISKGSVQHAIRLAK